MARIRILLDVAAVEERAATGLAEHQIARALGVSQDTLTARKKDQPGVAEALSRGRQAAVGEIENVMYECAKEARQEPKYQASAIFWLKVNAGWKETQVIETVRADDPARTRDALAERVRAFAGGAGGDAVAGGAGVGARAGAA